MTSSTRKETDRTAQAVIILFASINRSMAEIREILSSKPAVVKVTQTCDVRRYPSGGVMESPESHSFAVYVEAETKTGDLFCWSFVISLESEKWTLDRDIARQEKHGHISIADFDSAAYEDFSELQTGYEPLMSEFVRSAESFTSPT